MESSTKGWSLVHTLATHQAVYIWGSRGNQVSLSIFDLTCGGPNLRQLHWLCCDSCVHDGETLHSLKKRNLNPSHTRIEGVVCQCALHDNGYSIILPDTRSTLSEAVPVQSKWSWRKVRSPPEPSIDGGVKPDDTPARARALKRRDEWLRESIRYMKRADLDNDEIRIAWDHQRWTKYGRFDMPDRWKDMKLGLPMAAGSACPLDREKACGRSSLHDAVEKSMRAGRTFSRSVPRDLIETGQSLYTTHNLQA